MTLINKYIYFSFYKKILFANCNCDAPEYCQVKLQDPSSSIMEGILMFNKHLLFIVIVIVLAVGWLFFNTIYNFDYMSNSKCNKFLNSNPLRIIYTFVPQETNIIATGELGNLFVFFWFSEFCFYSSTLLLFIVLYLKTRKTNTFYKNFFKFYRVTPFFNRIALFSFSFSLAIPVRIWIKPKLPRFLSFFVTSILLYLATIFSFVTIFVLLQALLLINSFTFVFCYQNFPTFKFFIRKVLFAGNKKFAAIYFAFFWGNMQSGNLRRMIDVGVGTAFAYCARKTHEKLEEDASKKGIETTERAVKLASKPTTAEQVYDLERKAVKDARSENPILSFEDSVKEASTEFKNWLLGP